MSTPDFLDERLQQRYQQLVREQMAPAQSVAAGLRALPTTKQAFASTQGAWRFYKNERVTLPLLMQPILQQARDAIATTCGWHALVVHDWCKLHYGEHTAKADRIALANTDDEGYSLYTALLLSDRQGDPLAPVYLGLQSAAGVHGTLAAKAQPAATGLDSLQPVMDHLAGMRWNRPLVHLIDREADSVGHFRNWHQAGHRFVVRVKKDRIVQHEEQPRKLSAVVTLLRRRNVFRQCPEVAWHGRPRQQWIAETTITLNRAARPRRKGKVRKSVPGLPLTLRLVISEVRDDEGKVLARWLLLTNLTAGVTPETIALWYYWRWRIESFHKLLKSAGHHVEEWQQASADAVAKRLLVTVMACVTVWQLARDSAPEAEEVRTLLVRLSGRQTKRKRRVTHAALLAGLWVWLSFLELLEHGNLSEFQRLAQWLNRPRRRNTG